MATVETTLTHGVATLRLNRPETHNAFDEVMILELTEALAAAGADAGVRVVVLRGAGKSFCSGGDLGWMQRMAGFSDSENRADAAALARMLRTLDRCPKPVLAVVQGSAMGGGVGLVAASDIAIASDQAVFALSEARLGLVPATISPYVIEAIGARACRRYFLTGERFAAAEAYRLGLVHEICADDRIEARVAAVVEALLASAPGAQATAKELIRQVANAPLDPALIDSTAATIARVRSGEEAREGITAFFAKRQPNWVKT